MFIVGIKNMEFENTIHDILAFIDSEKCSDVELDLKKIYGIFNKCCIKSIVELIKINDSKANIIIMGIGMLYYIFFVILRYTKNLKLTIFLSERAILLYSEFIIQSSEKKKNGDLIFTPSLGDAITFAYKKTIGRLSIKHFEKKMDSILEYPLQDACLIMKSIFIYFIDIESKEHNYLDELNKLVGKELGISKWIEVTQDNINVFAKITEDEQWIHIDKEKSEKYSPYKTTIAHGFMILSLASRFSYDTLTIENVKMGVNYGVDRVRFTSATPSGGFVRGRVSLIECEKKDRSAKYKLGITVELKGHEKPVCVAETLAIAYE